LLYIIKDFDIFVIYNHNQNMMNMNYKPGQILCSKSDDCWVYISVLHSTKPQNASGAMQLHTCCDLSIDGDDGSKTITFARGNGTLFDVDTSFEEVREATSEEKLVLYNELVKAFKDYDLGWNKHFTDSTYLDILDWLAWEFDVELSSDIWRPGPIEIAMYEIQDYIWDVLCKETGNYQEKTVEPKMVSLEKICSWIDDVDISKYLSCIFSGAANISFRSDDFIRDLKKVMEE
jgi:hypothetical protein